MQTQHLTAQVDIAKVLGDLGKVVSSASGLLSQSTSGAAGATGLGG